MTDKSATSFASMLGRLRAGEGGNVLLTAAMLLLPTLGMAGLATDTAQWYLWKSQLQRQADSAALAGAYAVAEGQSGSMLAGVVQTDLELNRERAYTVEAIENAPTAGIKAGSSQAVRVVLSTQEALPFSSFFLSSPPLIRVAATAEFTGVPKTCVLALQRAVATGVSVAGSATVELGCAMMSNSAGASALTTGTGRVNATALRAAGGIVVGSGVTSSTSIQTSQAVQDDPFEGVPNPTWMPPGQGNVTVGSNQRRNLSPGYYTSLDIRGNATLAPGTYFIGAGGLQINGGSTVTGSGVTFVLTSSSNPFAPGSVGTARIAGNARINVTAPTSGPYAGLVIYRDRRATADGSTGLNISGDSNSLWQGSIYAPTSNIMFTGNSGMNTDCVQIVGFTVSFAGNSMFRNICPPSAGAGAFGGGASARLVE